MTEQAHTVRPPLAAETREEHHNREGAKTPA